MYISIPAVYEPALRSRTHVNKSAEHKNRVQIINRCSHETLVIIFSTVLSFGPCCFLVSDAGLHCVPGADNLKPLSLISSMTQSQRKEVFPPGFEPGTFRV